VEHLTVYQAKGLTATTNEQQYITDMLQRDYFLRILQEFATALALFLEKKKDNKDDDLEDLYRQYVGTYEVVRNLAFEELLQYAEDQWIADERMSRLEMTAELLYAESTYKAGPLRTMLLDKAYQVFDYVDAHGGTYSADRRKKMADIHQAIESSLKK
jgi:hypothetical protein